MPKATKIAAASILLLCYAATPVSSERPKFVDVISVMFATRGRNVGPATIRDIIERSRITRISALPGSETSTHSVYGIRDTCITAMAEETWRGGRLLYRQTYEDAPCYFPRRVAVGAGPVITEVQDGTCPGRGSLPPPLQF